MGRRPSCLPAATVERFRWVGCAVQTDERCGTRSTPLGRSEPFRAIQRDGTFGRVGRQTYWSPSDPRRQARVTVPVEDVELSLNWRSDPTNSPGDSLPDGCPRAASRGPLRPPGPDPARHLARRPPGGLRRQVGGTRQGRLPNVALDRPCGWLGSRPAADRRIEVRHDAALEPGRPNARLPVRPRGGAAGRWRRRKAGDGGGTEGGRHAGVAPAIRRWRGGATADRSAEGRLGGLVVAGRQTPVRRERRELDAAREEARAPTRGPATARHAADRHARLPVQRRWIHP